MNNSIEHLPEPKQNELKRIAALICRECDNVEMVILFGSYARGDWKDGPHEQGRGRLLIHKRSDYDILAVTRHEYIATNIALWDTIKDACAGLNVSAYVRILARDIDFINYKLRQGQYFFTEIIQQGISLYDSGNLEFDQKRVRAPAQEKRLIQADLDEVFVFAKEFFISSNTNFDRESYKLAAFELHQACEHTYKTILLIFAAESPQEHHLDILEDLAADYCPDLIGVLPRETDAQRTLFELLDYAYIGARYDRRYKITREQLAVLMPYVKKLHEVVGKCGDERIAEFDARETSAQEKLPQ